MPAVRHPFETWPSTGRRGAVVVLVALFVGASAVLGWAGNQLQHDDAPAGLLSLQFAGSPADAAEMVEPWAREGDLHLAGFALGVDFAYLLAYALLLAALAAAVATRARRNGRAGVAAAAALAGWAAWVGAGLDVVENLLMVPILGDPTSGSPAAVTGMALAKWTCVVYALLAIPVTALLGRRPAAPAPTPQPRGS